MRRKPISIPEEPRKASRPVPPDLVRAERAAILVIAFHGLVLLFLVGIIALLIWVAPHKATIFAGAMGLSAVGLTVGTLAHLARKQS